MSYKCVLQDDAQVHTEMIVLTQRTFNKMKRNVYSINTSLI